MDSLAYQHTGGRGSVHRSPMTSSKHMNNTYKILVQSPLLRPGLQIETEVSEKYLVPAVQTLMEKIRLINTAGGSETNNK